MTLQATIAKILTKRDSLTSAQCTAEIEKIGKRREKILARTAAIHSWPTGRGKLGPEREKIAETGNPVDLIKRGGQLAPLATIYSGGHLAPLATVYSGGTNS